MFFETSKLLWVVTAPSQLLLAAIVVGAGLLWTRHRRLGRVLVSAASLVGLLVTVLPVGPALMRPLEERFPIPEPPPDHVDGIVVLGGAIRPVLSQDRGQVALNKHAERFLEVAALARQHPAARVLFTGGSAALDRTKPTEAMFAPLVFANLAMPADRIEYEDQSRNTYENAVFTKLLADPREDQTWLLVTSARHMPRAVGCFRQVGFRVIPYPVDFETPPPPVWWRHHPLFSTSLVSFDEAVREWLGLVTYWATGRTTMLFPGPEG